MPRDSIGRPTELTWFVQLPGNLMLLLADAVSTSLDLQLDTCLGLTADSQDSAAALQPVALASATGDPEAVSLAMLLSVRGEHQSNRSLVVGDEWLQHQPAMRRLLGAGLEAEPDAADLRALAVLANLPVQGVLWCLHCVPCE